MEVVRDTLLCVVKTATLQGLADTIDVDLEGRRGGRGGGLGGMIYKAESMLCADVVDV